MKPGITCRLGRNRPWRRGSKLLKLLLYSFVGLHRDDVDEKRKKLSYVVREASVCELTHVDGLTILHIAIERQKRLHVSEP